MLRFLLEETSALESSIPEASSEGAQSVAEMARTPGGVLTIAALGLLVVFAVLVLLMGVIKLMGVLMRDKKKPAQAEPSTDPAAPAAPAKEAPGSCGEVALFDVPDRTAAMLMAITADKLGVPLNTLRFISIKEVK